MPRPCGLALRGQYCCLGATCTDVAQKKKRHMEAETKERLWNRNFVKVCIGNFLLYFSFYLIMPLLPLYLHDEFKADEQMIGIVLAGYTVTALVIRPFGGYLVDSFPRKAVLMVCYFLFFIFFAGYFLAWTVLLFAIVRTMHGFAFGSTTVSISTVAIDVLYPSRRAEGIGYYGLSNNLAMAVGPTIAIYMYHVVPDFHYMFAMSLVTSGIGLVVLSMVKMREREVIKRPPMSLDRFFLLKGWREGITMACFSFSYGVLSTYLAIYGEKELGITSGTGTFFMLMAVGLIISRIIGGRSLRQGRITHNAAEGMLMSLCGYTLFALVRDPIAYYSAALIIGLGNGHLCPAYQTMFINLAPNSLRGTANSTYLTSWDAGLGLGVLLGGWAAERIGYHGAFVMAAAINAIGVAGFFAFVRRSYLANKLR